MKKLYTKWAENMDEKHPHREYPRPQLVRKGWMNLNGEWKYQIVKGEEDTEPGRWKKILVPFALGTTLSGTEEILQPDETLWYRRTFAWQPGQKRTILHFEAVDQECTVYLNGFEVGGHKGGYTPFEMDVSQYVKYQNALMVRVKDYSDTDIYAFGKQRLKTGGIWYTPTAGIWGTVWMEELPEHAVESLLITPDYDHARVHIAIGGTSLQAKITVSAPDGSFRHDGLTQDGHYTVPMGDFHAWSTEDPFLYDVKIVTEDDEVSSYFGMRKFSVGRDKGGNVRFMLNDQPLFLSGLLDQGYTPDGKYTYATDAGMVEELETVKALGFNMLRKHVKVECRRWYYHCDRMGILVMQDMPNGGSTFSFLIHQALPLGLNIRRLKDDDHERFGRNVSSRKMYMHELDEMIETLYNCVSIFAWVPFNEGWGQFDSAKVTEHIKALDHTRLVDSASGWHDQGCGDFNSRHVYFHAFHVPKKDERILLLSEFGGYAWLASGHTECDKLFGYRKYKDRTDYDQAVNNLFEKEILDNVERGLSGCVYTQLADVETECNGLLTADRKIVKVDVRKMRKINERIYRKIQ